MERAFIGDVHGRLADLEEVVEHALSRTRRLVFLGDYINRGRNSREVVDYLVQLNRREDLDCIFLRGNHDAVFLNTLLGDSIDNLLRMGGATTVASYVPAPVGNVALQLQQNVPDSHVQFFRDLRPWMITKHVFAAHDPGSAPVEIAKGRYCIYGHVPQRSGKPTISRSHALIDTGCGTTEDGRLTCLFWPELHWFQSTPR